MVLVRMIKPDLKIEWAETLYGFTINSDQPYQSVFRSETMPPTVGNKPYSTAGRHYSSLNKRKQA